MMNRLNRFISSAALCLSLSITPPASAMNHYGDELGDQMRVQYFNENIARLFRGSVPLSKDPFVTTYLEEVLWYMAPFSQLEDPQLELIVVDTPVLNAFAAPGGIIGIHTGLLLYAEHEDELASVVAHELAHLSQRHYEHSKEQQARNQPLMIAGVIASMIAASASGDAATAGITSSLALAEQSRLSFSRQHEKEADNIGMQSLAASGFDPFAMPRMFQRMQHAARFGQKPPEFLLTHPVTESRIADSQSRAEQLGRQSSVPRSDDFYLMRARIQAQSSSNQQQLLNRYLKALQKDATLVNRYGAAIAALNLNDFDQARSLASAFTPQQRQNPIVGLLEAEIDLATERYQDARQRIEQTLQFSPRSYAARMLLGHALTGLGMTDEAVEVYRALTLERPHDANVQFQLAETEGLKGNTAGVHLARIEYFLLTGQIDPALRQIEFGLRTPRLNQIDKARFERYREEAEQIRKELDEMF